MKIMRIKQKKILMNQKKKKLKMKMIIILKKM